MVLKQRQPQIKIRICIAYIHQSCYGAETWRETKNARQHVKPLFTTAKTGAEFWTYPSKIGLKYQQTGLEVEPPKEPKGGCPKTPGEWILKTKTGNTWAQIKKVCNEVCTLQVGGDSSGSCSEILLTRNCTQFTTHIK